MNEKKQYLQVHGLEDQIKKNIDKEDMVYIEQMAPQYGKTRIVKAIKELISQNIKLRNQTIKAADAIEAILKNRDLGEYESQKQGLPRMIEVNNMGRTILEEIRSNE